LAKHGTRVGLSSALQQMFSRNRNMSQQYSKACKKMDKKRIGMAPAYDTRLRNRIDVPSKEEFNSAFLVIKHKYLPLKTKDNSFQTLNRTIWTNNKAFKSGQKEGRSMQVLWGYRDDGACVLLILICNGSFLLQQFLWWSKSKCRCL